MNKTQKGKYKHQVGPCVITCYLSIWYIYVYKIQNSEYFLYTFALNKMGATLSKSKKSCIPSRHTSVDVDTGSKRSKKRLIDKSTIGKPVDFIVSFITLFGTIAY